MHSEGRACFVKGGGSKTPPGGINARAFEGGGKEAFLGRTEPPLEEPQQFDFAAGRRRPCDRDSQRFVSERRAERKPRCRRHPWERCERQKNDQLMLRASH